jgi:hypothetical protein
MAVAGSAGPLAVSSSSSSRPVCQCHYERRWFCLYLLMSVERDINLRHLS